MPPKELQHITITDPAGGTIYLDGFQLDSVPDLTPREMPKEEKTEIFIGRSISCEFNCKVKNPGKLTASLIMLLTGNDLYLRFPKKLRRRRKRRCRNI